MRYVALAVVAATLLCTAPASAGDADYVEHTGPWAIVGNRLGHTSITCVMMRDVESNDGGGGMLMYMFRINTQPMKGFLTLVLQTKLPVNSKPQATITFSGDKTVKLKSTVEGASKDALRVININVPFDEKLGLPFRSALQGGSEKMTIVLTVPAANGKAAQQETSVIALDGVDDALTLRGECMQDLNKAMFGR